MARVYRSERGGEKESQANTHNDCILRREQGPVDIAGSGPGRDANMRRKRGERSATHPQLRATIAEACRRADSDPWMNTYPRELSGVVGKCGGSGTENWIYSLPPTPRANTTSAISIRGHLFLGVCCGSQEW